MSVFVMFFYYFNLIPAERVLAPPHPLPLLWYKGVCVCLCFVTYRKGITPPPPPPLDCCLSCLCFVLVSQCENVACQCVVGSIHCSQNEIYDIGTEILNLQCLNYSQTQLFCKSIIPEEIQSPGPVLSYGSVKT